MPSYKQTLTTLIQAFAEAARTNNAVLIQLAQNTLNAHLEQLPNDYTPPTHDNDTTQPGTGSTCGLGSGASE